MQAAARPRSRPRLTATSPARACSEPLPWRRLAARSISSDSTAGSSSTHADRRAHVEVHLAGDLVVDLGGQHAVRAAHDDGIAEVGDRHAEYHEGGGEQAVARLRQGDVDELPPRRGAHGFGRVVQAAVGARQRGAEDQHRLRQGIGGVGDQQAPEAVDVGGQPGPAMHQPVAAEQEQQAEALHQRRRQHRQQQHRARPASAARSRERCSAMRDGQPAGDRQHRGAAGHQHAVPGRAQQARFVPQPGVVGQRERARTGR